MNEKTLERLLVDRKLNELSPDASELLEAYLHVQPQFSTIRDSVDSTLELVRKAVAPSPTASDSDLPPPPRFLAEISLSPRRIPTFIRFRPWAIAAAVLFAFVAGGEWGPRFSQHGPSTVQVAVGGAERSKPASEQFWSLRRLRSGAGQDNDNATTRVRWVSPLAWPQNGDRS